MAEKDRPGNCLMIYIGIKGIQQRKGEGLRETPRIFALN